jgi:hypothetical protein
LNEGRKKFEAEENKSWRIFGARYNQENICFSGGL